MENKDKNKKNDDLKMIDIGSLERTTEVAERFMYPYKQLNYLLNGGIFGRVVMISSWTDNGKSTLVSHIIDDVIAQGHKVGAYFGEDSVIEARDRIFKQATSYSSTNIIYHTYEVNGNKTNTGEYLLSESAFNKAKAKFANKLFLYPTSMGGDVDKILEQFEKSIINDGVRVFVLDNVDQFEFNSENENKAMRDIQIKIRNFAIEKKVLIFLVAHVRKTDKTVVMPSLNDIKGTSALINIARDVMIIVRTDKLDRTTKEYKQFSQLLRLNNYDIEEKDKNGDYKIDAIIHVAKTKGRKLGFVCLGFNRITQTYYDINKIDESIEEGLKAKVVAGNVKLLDVTDEEIDILPF